MKLIEKIFDFFSSIRLAVVIILALGIISAVGTIYEARFDAEVAQKLVYKSIYMYVVMGALAVNLIAVMIDRLPWKRHHTPFILAHIGILLLLVGSMVTQRYGIDGSMSFAIGQTNRFVTVPETELAVYTSTDSSMMTQLFQRPVDFFLAPPQNQNYDAMIGDDKLEVIDYIHYGLRQSEVVVSEKASDGPAIRLQLQNPNVNMSQWLVAGPSGKPNEVQLGPAKVVISEAAYNYTGGNVLWLQPASPKWKFTVFTASKGGLTQTGKIGEGEKVPTGWMGLEMTALRILPKAREVITYMKREKPGTNTRPAIQVAYRGEKHWVGLNSVLKLFKDNGVVWISFANRRIDVGFELQLDKFEVGMYQGTSRAASYQSEVSAPEIGKTIISMNEPLHYRKFTFYQASFEKDEMGRPIASILSVNYDPGLWVKYLGSFLIVLGAILLFYFKRSFIKKNVAEAP